MMKTYIKPQTTVVDVETERLLVDWSNTSSGGTLNGGGNKQQAGEDMSASKNQYPAALWDSWDELLDEEK